MTRRQIIDRMLLSCEPGNIVAPFRVIPLPSFLPREDGDISCFVARAGFSLHGTLQYKYGLVVYGQSYVSCVSFRGQDFWRVQRILGDFFQELRDAR